MKEFYKILYSILCICVCSFLIVIYKDSNAEDSSVINTSSNHVPSLNTILPKEKPIRKKSNYKEYKNKNHDKENKNKKSNHISINTQQPTATSTIAVTPTFTQTYTPTFTITPSPTATFTPTFTNTFTSTNTPKLSDSVYFIRNKDNFILNAVEKNIKDVLKHSEVFTSNNIKIDTKIIDKNFENFNDTVSKISADKNAKLVVTFSQSIYERISKTLKDIPIVFTMLLSLNDIKNNSKLPISKNTLGVRSPFAYSAIADLVNRYFTKKQIIIIYNGLDEESYYGYIKLRDSLNKKQISTIKYNVKNINDIKNLSVLKAESDSSLAILVTSELFLDNYEEIRDNLKKIKMPIITFSQIELRKFDAILSLGIDYKTLGRQTAEKILQVLENSKLNNVDKIELARLYKLAVNKKRAKELNIKIPRALANEADILIK